MKEYKGVERRSYIRLKSVFPVEFRLLSLDEKKKPSPFLQGFTADVSKGGILLRVNNLEPELVNILEKREAKLLLNINIPLFGKPVRAVSAVAWMTAFKEGERDLCLIGLSFEKINDKDRRRLVGYSASLYRMPKLTAVVFSLMLIALGIERVEEINLRKENALLVERLADTLQRKSDIVEWLGKADREKSVLLAKLEGEIQDRKTLKEELDNITYREKARLQELERIETARLRLEKATLDNMYNWLKVHQNRRTGLIASYEGDSALKNTAFIYDQSLVAQVFLLHGDAERAKSILDFFNYRAERHKGSFTNAYGVNNGAITEYTVHCGPNIWLGIALMQYMDETGSEEYLDLTKEIGDWVIEIQDQDPDGGIRGGPDVEWFSTEHNLDAYALFTMLAQKTGIERYRDAAEKSLDWIKNNAYTGSEGRIYRGKGDSTIATDTFSWAIASIGPETLIDARMDPNAIMEFAEDNCKVAVDFVRPDGRVVKITGFDFAKDRHMPRGGVVSSEWTAQMIVSLRIMCDFYLDAGDYERAKYYRDKCAFYMDELEKMIITSPSRSGQGAGCLPYATLDNVDTGHGWRTPHGRDTGSVSGTAYGIFAIKGYNPLKLASSE